MTEGCNSAPLHPFSRSRGTPSPAVTFERAITQANATQSRTPTNAINWFEIPVLDFDRAVRFHESVLSVKLKQELFGSKQFAVFPASEPGVAGALVKGAGRLPGGTGILIYIDAPELEESLMKTATAGGKIALPLTDIGPMGQIAAVIDPDGNRIGLHRSPQAAQAGVGCPRTSPPAHFASPNTATSS